MTTIIVSYYDVSKERYTCKTGTSVTIQQAEIGSADPYIFVAIIPD